MRKGDLRNQVADAGRVVIITHRNADPDAVASAYATKLVVENIVRGTEVSIVHPDGISHASKQLLSKVGISYDYSREPHLQPRDFVLLIDVARIEQTGLVMDYVRNLVESGDVKIGLIDHHETYSELLSLASFYLYDPKASSSSELVYELASEYGIELPKQALTLLLGGIVFDTRRFVIVSPRVFRVVAELIEKGGNYGLVLESMYQRPSFAERVARLKSIKRARMLKLGDDVIIAVSHVSAYEGSAARALIDAGADLAIVVGSHNGEVRISTRASQRFIEVTGIATSKLMEYLASKLKGAGGGHSLAAALTVRGEYDVDELVERCIALLREVLPKDMKLKEITD